MRALFPVPTTLAAAAVAAACLAGGCQSPSLPPSSTRVYESPDSEQSEWVVRQILNDQQERTGVRGSANFKGDTVAITTTEEGQSQVRMALEDIRTVQSNAARQARSD
jgi:hypothetical protein